MFFTGQGRSVLGKIVPEVLSNDVKIEGIVSPNTDRLWPVNNVIYLFLTGKANSLLFTLLVWVINVDLVPL